MTRASLPYRNAYQWRGRRHRAQDSPARGAGGIAASACCGKRRRAAPCRRSSPVHTRARNRGCAPTGRAASGRRSSRALDLGGGALLLPVECRQKERAEGCQPGAFRLSLPPSRIGKGQPQRIVDPETPALVERLQNRGRPLSDVKRRRDIRNAFARRFHRRRCAWSRPSRQCRGRLRNHVRSGAWLLLRQTRYRSPCRLNSRQGQERRGPVRAYRAAHGNSRNSGPAGTPLQEG